MGPEFWQTVQIVLTIVVLIGAVILGTIKLMQSKSKNAKEEAIDHSDTCLDVAKIEINAELKDMHTEVNSLINRMDELDTWRREMNGQLKLINERQKFTNQILEEQKTNLVLVTNSLNSVSTNIAVLGEAVKNSLEKEKDN